MSVVWGGKVQHATPNITSLVDTEDNDDDRWDLPLPPAAGATVTDTTILPSPSTNDREDYNDKGGG